MDDEHRALQFGADLLQVRADLVAVAGVVHHDEQHGFLAERLVFGVALAPFLDAELQVVGVFLGEDRALVLVQLGAAGGVGQHRMLDDVLVDGLDQRVVATRSARRSRRCRGAAWRSRPPAAPGGGPSAASGGGCPGCT